MTPLPYHSHREALTGIKEHLELARIEFVFSDFKSVRLSESFWLVSTDFGKLAE